ncbi:hypothetical protein OU415_25440 [Saccharopolyspora sp. WRP15-2]|uniref:Uncharacterized protein n=1 Tax=Saccharopolyspora oryzae TaxID=2997343 RepID=A0ABT4V5U0_9PSEU|nr:hypothetical protein [Saccharopolyspora oryzae]MDA3628801.1 hypothetical protein [Saccharopolyspora oryzae]
MGLVQETRRSLYATVGATAWVVERLRDVPTQVEHAWQERERVMHQLQGAYDHLAGRGEALVGEAQQGLGDLGREVGQAARRIPGVAVVEGELAGAVVDEEELPIAHYDRLTAAEIVQKLPGLSQRELREVRGYETRNQARATVVGRIDDLCEEEPWPGYDEMRLDEILPRMRASSVAEQEMLVSYERRHKSRRTIVDAFGHG